MNKFISYFAFIIFSILSVNSGYSIPPTFNMTIKNIIRLPNPTTGADSILQFDIYLFWTNPSAPGVDSFEYGSNQLNITFNPLIANGGTLAASRVTSGLPSGSLPAPC